MISLNFSGFAGAAQQPAPVQGSGQTGGSGQTRGEGLSALFAGLLESLSKGVDQQGLGFPSASGGENDAAVIDREALQSLLSQLSELDPEQLTEEQQLALAQLQKQIQVLQGEGDTSSPEQALAQVLLTLGISPSANPERSAPGSGALSPRQDGAELVRLATAAFERSARGRESASEAVSRPLASPSAGASVQAQPGTGPAGNSQVLELLNTLVVQGARSETTPGRAGTQSLPSGLELRLDGVGGPGQKPLATEWAPLKVDTGHAQWTQDLMSALGDRLNMQVNQQVREATVRLDPPDLGRIDLTVRMDGDRLNVQLNASNPAVRDMLTQHAERLRSDLLEQNLQTVDVQVGTGDQREGGSGYQQDEPIIAGQSLPEDAGDSGARDRDEDRWLSTSA